MSSDLEKNGDPEGEAVQAGPGNGTGFGPKDHSGPEEAAAPAEIAATGGPEAPAPVSAAKQPLQGRGPVRRFIRSVVSHVVFAGIVTACVVGLLYQREILNKLGDELCTDDRLGGYMTRALRPAALPAVEADKAVPLAPAAPPAPVSSAPAPPAPVAAPPEQPAKPTLTANPARQEAESPQPAAANPAPAQHDPQEEAVAAPALPQPAAPVQVEQPSVPSSGSARLTSTAAAAHGTAEAADGIASDWQAARQAAANHQPDAANLYGSLVNRYPGVAALRGEFGNVLYGMGRMKEAAEQYYEVALLQLKGPQPELAACLEDIIQRIDAGRAEMLRPQIVHPCPHSAK